MGRWDLGYLPSADLLPISVCRHLQRLRTSPPFNFACATPRPRSPATMQVPGPLRAALLAASNAVCKPYRAQYTMAGWLE